MQVELAPLFWERLPDSPPLEPGKESIRLAVPTVQLTGGTVQLDFRASYMLPKEVADRYENFHEAMVLVLNDLDQRDGAALRMFNAFIDFPRQEEPERNMITPPALPLPPRGSLQAEVYRGGWLNGSLSFSAPNPVHRPSVFLHLVLENYVSNSVGLDLIAQAAVEF